MPPTQVLTGSRAERKGICSRHTPRRRDRGSSRSSASTALAELADSDGKGESSRRTISLDPFTVAALTTYVAMLDEERRAFGASYPAHGKLMCYEDGRQLHPDTVTRRFNRPARVHRVTHRLTRSWLHIWLHFRLAYRPRLSVPSEC